jgi:hypothetical protein
VEEEIVVPSVHLLESMRSVGYSLGAALADLIDNSITGGATSVKIEADVLDGTFVSIFDDGVGMSASTARAAMRLAGSVGERTKEDLGRFGLGLKTASLSQARCVTLVTKQDGVTTGLRWDIDHVLSGSNWSLLVLDAREVEDIPQASCLVAAPSGTLVVWTGLDLLLGDALQPGKHLGGELEVARLSLSLIFHRFLGKKRGPAIAINGSKLTAVDPFLESNPRTLETHTEGVLIAGERVEVTAFTLPHHAGMRPVERARPQNSSAMRESQGFYVYRNDRLISYGSWFGLATKSELTKQTRVRVDIPNSLDHLWRLDIKKSSAVPPASFRAHLKRIIDPILEKGRRVHTQRSRKASSKGDSVHVWDRIDHDQGSVSYKVNLKHPLILALRDHLDGPTKSHFGEVLELIANNFPTYDLYSVLAASGLLAGSEKTDEKALENLRLLRSLGALGPTTNEVVAQLMKVEPFDAVQNLHVLVDRVLKEETFDTEQ